MLAALFLVIAMLGVAFAALVLRADRSRWDNRVFAALAMLDSALSVIRSVAVFSGRGLGDNLCLGLCGDGSVLLAWVTIEFAYSFPFNRPLPWRYRWAGFVWVTAQLLLGHLTTINWFMSYGEPFYFLPTFLISLYLLRRNYRRTAGRRSGIALVMGALIFRWAFAVATYNIAWRFGHEVFTAFLWAESTHVTVLGNLLMIYAILRNHFFSVRGALGEVLLNVGYGIAILGLTWFGIEYSFHFAANQNVLRVSLMAMALLPIGLFLLARQFRAPVEEALLRNLDPRRALRKRVVARVIQPVELDPDALKRATFSALSEVTAGGEVRFIEELPPSLAAYFAGSPVLQLRPAEALDLPPAVDAELRAMGDDLLVPVRSSRAQAQKLFGALAVKGGNIDRESMVAAVTLAGHLALRLENHALFAELESARRLATLGAFAAAIAHDIRTPLTSVKMNVQILRGKVNLPPDDMEYFDIALEELNRLNSHISEILDYAKPVKLQVTPMVLREVVDDAARAISPLLKERQISVELEHASALPQVMGDSQRIRQVLWNLLDNAAKASPEGSAIVLRTRVTDDGRTAVEVADSGRGIDVRDLPKIFEPFFTTRPDGTGLGLAICQKLVRAHEGEIQVRSTLGVGTTFTVLLPTASGQ